MKFLDVKYLSYCIANYLYKYVNSRTEEFKEDILELKLPIFYISHQRRYIIYYILQVIITLILQLSIILFIGYLLGIFEETTIATASFITLRFYAGGPHADTRLKCTIISPIIVFVSVFLGKITNIYFCIPLLILSFILLYIYSPRDTKNIPITNPIKRKRNRIISFIIFFIWVIEALYYSSYTGIITIPILFECLSLIKIKSVLRST
ncbi:MAG: accessory gene regulator ArgB-like protein [Ignavibacteriales bacterium]